MPFDMTRCPQTEAEARDWFYAGIGQTLGAPATNWESVMTNCGLPPGYGPGVIPNASMPFFAFTQQFSDAPKGRIFLPSATPDENGYYTRCMQYLDDAAGTYAESSAQSQSGPLPDFQAHAKTKSAAPLVWAWYWVAGHDYNPVQSAEGTAPPASGGGLTEADVQAMIDAQCVKYGDRIALRTAGDSGAGIPKSLISVDEGGPRVNGDPVQLTGRTQASAGPWETLTVEEGQG